MIIAVREGLEMPPDGRLTAEQISVLEAWVKQSQRPEHHGSLVNGTESRRSINAGGQLNHLIHLCLRLPEQLQFESGDRSLRR